VGDDHVEALRGHQSALAHFCIEARQSHFLFVKPIIATISPYAHRKSLGMRALVLSVWSGHARKSDFSGRRLPLYERSAPKRVERERRI